MLGYRKSSAMLLKLVFKTDSAYHKQQFSYLIGEALS